jgi:hypothetical protein
MQVVVLTDIIRIRIRIKIKIRKNKDANTMGNLLIFVLYGAYFLWKRSFYGIRNETNDKEMLFNIVCAIAIFTLFTCLDTIVLYVILFNKIEYTSYALAGHEAIGTLIIIFISLSTFFSLFLNKNKYINIFQNLGQEETKKYLSLSLWIVYMIIPFVAMVLMS